MMRTVAALGLALAVLTMPAKSQAVWTPDSFFGNWALDGAESHYAQASPPTQMTLVIEPAQEGLAYRSETHYVGGRIASSQFIARLDETPALVVGTTGFLAPVSLAPSSDGGIDAVYKSGIKKVAWSHWSVSAAGSELVITTTYLNVQGEEKRNVALFRRTNAR
jgi:hypothetical protein